MGFQNVALQTRSPGLRKIAGTLGKRTTDPFPVFILDVPAQLRNGIITRPTALHSTIVHVQRVGWFFWWHLQTIKIYLKAYLDYFF